LPGIKSAGMQTEHSLPSSAAVKNKCSYTATPPYKCSYTATPPYKCSYTATPPYVLGAFAKLPEATILASSCLSLCSSVCMEKLGSHWMDFHEILYLSILRKSVKKIRVSLKFKISFYMKTSVSQRATIPLVIYTST